MASPPAPTVLSPSISKWSTVTSAAKPKDLDPTSDLTLTRCTILKRDAESIDDALLKHTAPRPFSLSILAAAIANYSSPNAIQHYLQSYPSEQIGIHLRQLVKDKHPILFYATERNDADIVRILLEHGADPEARDHLSVPVLAYAIMRSKWTVLNPLEVVKTLLAYQAKPQVIPEDMWTDFMRVPTAKAEKETHKSKHTTIWCTKYYRQILAETLHLSLRYFMYKATQITPALARGIQLARAHNYLPLLRTPYLVIGQYYACKLVVEQVSSHIGMNVDAPLVLTFAGLSGHGKTELATKMGQLLGVSLTNIDCAQMRSDVGLFGSHMGYVGNATGSQLNNHLAANDGKRCVVFLDEFDKTEQEVRHSLLLLLDSGEYHDRRNNKPIDCTKTIWILATNLGDREITRWYDENMEELPDDERVKINFKTLTSSLRNVFSSKFGAPMAGRMAKAICPFLPFDLREQTVITHKFLLDLVEQARRDINTSPMEKHYPGHIHLVIQNDGPMCEYMAEESFVPELGARSLRSAVDDVRRSFYTTFVDSDEVIDNSMNEGPLVKYNIHLQPIAGAASEVVVQEDGITEYFDGRTASDHLRSTDPMQVDKDDEAMAGLMHGIHMGRSGPVDEDL